MAIGGLMSVSPSRSGATVSARRALPVGEGSPSC